MLGLLGLLHEHQRNDRDEYVTIKWENIPYGYDRHFAKLKRSKTLGLPYDITSIMHYFSTQAASPIGASSIVSKVLQYCEPPRLKSTFFQKILNKAVCL